MKYDLNSENRPEIRRNQCFFEIPQTGYGYTTEREFEDALNDAHIKFGNGRIEYYMISAYGDRCSICKDFA